MEHCLIMLRNSLQRGVVQICLHPLGVPVPTGDVVYRERATRSSLSTISSTRPEPIKQHAVPIQSKYYSYKAGVRAIRQNIFFLWRFDDP